MAKRHDDALTHGQRALALARQAGAPALVAKELNVPWS